MKIETLEVSGFQSAFKALRNPMDSWAKSDSVGGIIGPVDQALSLKLQKAGTEHCKHLRMIQVWADVRAPRYWWTEADTYRHGVEKVSCSTMHRLMARPLELEDFECDSGCELILLAVISAINSRMENYKALLENGLNNEAKEVWREIIQILPQSYLQTRTCMFSYAVLRKIIKERTGHKLSEWAEFIKWCRTLPYADVLLFDGDMS